MGSEVIWVALIGGLLGGGGIVAWWRAHNERPVQQATAENLNVETQALVIKSLRDENTRLEKMVQALRKDVAEYRREVAQLRGHLEAMEALKINEIARATAREVVRELTGDDDLA